MIKVLEVKLLKIFGEQFKKLDLFEEDKLLVFILDMRIKKTYKIPKRLLI